MEWFLVSVLLLVATMLQGKAVDIYIYSTKDNISGIHYFTLQDYMYDTERLHQPFPYKGNYSNTRLLLQPGKHFLQTDFIIQNTHDFTVQGNDSKIYCNKSFLVITFINVSGITLNNTEIINCGKSYVLQSSSKAEAMNTSSAVYFDHCIDVNVHGVSVTVQSGTSGMIVINSSQRKYESSIFQNITIMTNCTKTLLTSSGMLLYYHNHHSLVITSEYREVQLSNYKYETIGICNNSFALNIATNQTIFEVTINVFDTSFKYLKNSGVLNYHGESYGVVKSILNFINCSIEHNQGNKQLKLLHVVVSNHHYTFDRSRNNINTCDKQSIKIYFTNCSFANNSNMKSILHILLRNSQSANVLINISNSTFVGNHEMHIIKVSSKVKILWQLTHYLILIDTRILSNRHTGLGLSLISCANGLVKFLHSVIIKNNRCNWAIVRLYYSVLRFQGNCVFSGNHASVILDSTQASYYIMKENSELNMTKNYVYSIMYLPAVLNNDEHKPYCYFQFLSNQSNLEQKINENTSLNYKINFIDNIYSAPEYVIQQTNSDYENCTWLEDTAFVFTNSSVIYSKVMTETIKYANRSLETTSLTICTCVNASVYNCTQRHLGVVSPGQTLTVKLKLARLQSSAAPFITTFTETENMPHACHLLNVLEIQQKLQRDQCIEHNYTVWSGLSECELYLRTGEVTETLYIKLSACPAGFALYK